MTWIVAVSHPQREFRALASLQEHGFWAWLPTRTVTRRPKHLKGREIVREYPFFGGGYVFVRDAPTCSVRSRSLGHRDLYGVDDIRAIVCSVVGLDRRPLTISDDRMDVVRNRIENPIPMVEDALRIGDDVYLTDGPFASFRATVGRVGPKDAVSVLINYLGRATPVLMSVDQLEKVA